jgi:hypothetical protein
MKDSLDSLKRLLDCLRIVDVPLDELDSIFHLGNIGPMPGAKIVQDPDTVPFIQQTSDDMGTDKATSTRD